MQPSPTPSVRPYRSGDLDAVIAIFLGAIRKTAARDYDPAQIDAWAQADRDRWAAKRLDRPTWLALVGPDPAGLADLEANGRLDMLYVHPAHGGAGVATALLQTVEAAAREGGLKRLFTEASLTARPFFAKRGFKTVAEQTVERRGQRFINFKMDKLLG